MGEPDLAKAVCAPVVFFCGNACGQGSGLQFAKMVFEELWRPNDAQRPMCLQLYTSTYRGAADLGGTGEVLNPGPTNEKTLVADASDLLSYALRNTSSSQGKALVAGWSMGAGISWQLAITRSDSVAGVLTIAPWSTLWEES